MTVGIIGAGFAGLSAAYYLAKAGHEVTVFEQADRPGGLAAGFNDVGWDWVLERHYHHLFTSDWAIRNLAAEIGHPLIYRRPKTSTYINGEIYQLDSPLSLLTFPALSFFNRLRTGLVLAYLRYFPLWQPLENFTAHQFLQVTMGQKSWQTLWAPLFTGKFGAYADQISAAWFWGRISKRSRILLYPRGGFQSLADSIGKVASTHGVKFKYQTEIQKISQSSNSQITVQMTNGEILKYGIVLCTLPTPIFAKLSGLKYTGLTGIGAVDLVLALKEQFLADGTYWLNINDRSFPFISIVEHTNFMDKSHYGGDHLVYVGNYLPPDHQHFRLEATDILRIYLPFLQKINSSMKSSWIRKAWLFKAPFAQPIVTKNYSQLIPPFTTPIPHLYLANIQQVYPQDRGTTYAVELGQKVARLICSKLS